MFISDFAIKRPVITVVSMLTLVAFGLVLGLGLATGVARLISSLLFGLEATDTVTFGQVTLVVAAVSMLACALPTVRAAASYGTSKSTTNFMRRMNAGA